MIIPELKEDLRGWDAWKAFHWCFSSMGSVSSGSYYGPDIVVFDTQEMAYLKWNPGPESRGTVNGFNIRILATGDGSELPVLYTPDDPDPIPKAWLNEGGQQYLLHDLDTNRVVGLTGGLRDNHLVPLRLRQRAAAYFAGPGSPPIGAPITVSQPARNVLCKSERELIDGIKAACDMQFALTTPPVWDRTAPGANWTPAGTVDPQRLLQAGSVSALSNNEKVQLHKFGVGRVRTQHDYLLAL